MLGGLNPSTDLLVGSTSQYGPVLTELPSSQQQQQQLKPMNAAGDHQHNQQEDATRHVALPLSDHEEETRTLMHEATTPSHAANAIADQLPG